MTTTVRRTGSRASSQELGPLATLAAQTFVIVGVPVGFGAVDAPLGVEVLVSCLAFGALVIAPPTVIRRLIVPVPFVIFLVWWAGSVGWSIDPDATILRIKKDLAIPLAGLVAAAILPRDRFLWALGHSFRLGIGVTAVILAVSPDTRLRRATQFQSELEGWHGHFTHKNSLAIYLVLGIAVFLTVDRPGPVRVASIAAAFVLLVGAQSATGIAGVLGIIVLWLWLVSLRRAQRRWRAGVVAFSAIGATTLGAALVLLLPNLLAFYGKDLTFTGRTDVWSAVIGAIGDRPLVGHGLGAVFAPTPNQVYLEVARESGFQVPHPHQGTLDILLSLGAIGLVLFAASLIVTVVAAIRLIRFDPPVAHMVLLMTFAIVILSLSESVFLGSPMLMLGIAQVLVFTGLRNHRDLPTVSG